MSYGIYDLKKNTYIQIYDPQPTNAPSTLDFTYISTYM